MLEQQCHNQRTFDLSESWPCFYINYFFFSAAVVSFVEFVENLHSAERNTDNVYIIDGADKKPSASQSKSSMICLDESQPQIDWAITGSLCLDINDFLAVVSFVEVLHSAERYTENVHISDGVSTELKKKPSASQSNHR